MPHIPTRLRTVFGKNGKTNFIDNLRVYTTETYVDSDTIINPQTSSIWTDASCKDSPPSPRDCEQDHYRKKTLQPYPLSTHGYTSSDADKSKEEEEEGEGEQIERKKKGIRKLKVSGLCR